jgi:hypothetical protein
MQSVALLLPHDEERVKMAKIRAVKFKAAVDSQMRQGFLHGTHASVHALIADEQTGDAIEVEYDDGSTEDYMLEDATLVPAQHSASPAPQGKKRPSQWLRVAVRSA